MTNFVDTKLSPAFPLRYDLASSTN